MARYIAKFELDPLLKTPTMQVHSHDNEATCVHNYLILHINRRERRIIATLSHTQYFLAILISQVVKFRQLRGMRRKKLNLWVPE